MHFAALFDLGEELACHALQYYEVSFGRYRQNLLDRDSNIELGDEICVML